MKTVVNFKNKFLKPARAVGESHRGQVRPKPILEYAGNLYLVIVVLLSLFYLHEGQHTLIL